MQLSSQSIAALCAPHLERPMITPFVGHKVRIDGKSYGLSAASYDIRIESNVTLGVHPGIILQQHILRYGRIEDNVLIDTLRNNPPHFALANALEKFCMPDDVSASVADKSTFARLHVSAYNTFIDPGFEGDLTLELVNDSDKPVRIFAGTPICQLLFTRLDQPTNKPYRGKYQHQKGVTPAIMEQRDGA